MPKKKKVEKETKLTMIEFPIMLSPQFKVLCIIQKFPIVLLPQMTQNAAKVAAAALAFAL